MKISIAPSKYAGSGYDINTQGNRIGGIQQIGSTTAMWTVYICEGFEAAYTSKEVTRIRAAAEKKCTTLNILRRLTL